MGSGCSGGHLLVKLTLKPHEHLNPLGCLYQERTVPFIFVDDFLIK